MHTSFLSVCLTASGLASGKAGDDKARMQKLSGSGSWYKGVVNLEPLEREVLPLKPQDLLMLFTLAALWGGSFLFMRIGAPDLGPYTLSFLRVAIAGFVLWGYEWIRRQRLGFLRKWKQYLLLGLLNAALPFSLISMAELYIPASLAAILNATTPLFTAIVAWIWVKDALTPKKIAGLVLGVIGVAVLVGWEPHGSGGRLLASASLSLLAAMSYAVAGVYSAKAFKGEKLMDLAIGQQLGASVVLIPAAGATLPHGTPAFTAILAALGLAIFCTSMAYPLYFALMRSVGPVKTLSVTFLTPVFGMVWGAVFLGEKITLRMIAGLLIILLSVTFVLNVPLVRRRPRLAR
jgi:drug/metabolite transporter (DMT)-like permease